MSHLALNFVMQPCLAEWKWLEIYSFDSVWETSSIRNPTNSVRVRSSGLQLHEPWQEILPFFSRMSRLHLSMPTQEGTSVKFSQGKLMRMGELLLWLATIRVGKSSPIARSLSPMGQIRKMRQIDER